MTTNPRSAFWRFWNHDPAFKPYYDALTMRTLLWRLARSEETGALEIKGIVLFRSRKFEKQVTDLLCARDSDYPLRSLLELEAPGRSGSHTEAASLEYAHDIKAPIKGCGCKLCSMCIYSGDGAWTEKGEGFNSKKQTKRALEVEEIKNDLMEGVPQEEMVWKHHAFIARSPAVYKMMEQAANKARMKAMPFEPPTVYLLYGDTAAGKTYLAGKIFEAHGVDTFEKDADSKWWDLYGFEEGVLINEFEGQNAKDGMAHNYFKTLLDGKPKSVQVKGSTMFIRPKVIVITSNTPMEQWWPGLSAANLWALKRRIAHTWHQSPCGWIHMHGICNCAEKGIPVTPLRGLTTKPLNTPFPPQQPAAQPHAFVALDFRNPKHAHSIEAAREAKCVTPVAMEQDNRDPYGSYADIAAVEEQMQVEAFFMDKAADAAMMELDTSRMRFSPPR